MFLLRYTPLLPAVATGTIEERSIVEPVRKVLRGKGNYFEACVEQIFPEEKVWLHVKNGSDVMLNTYAAKI